MFVCSDSDRESLVDPGMSLFSWVRLYPIGVIFLVQLDLPDEKIFPTRTVLFGHAGQVEHALLSDEHGMTVRCVQALCPCGADSQPEWKLHRLKQIWKLPDIDARRCVMDDGTVIFTDIAGYRAKPSDWSLAASC